MALKRILFTLPFACCCLMLQAQLVGDEDHPRAGIEIGIPGPSLHYPAFSIGSWFWIWKRGALTIETGYGGKGMFLPGDQIDHEFAESHQRVFATLQYIHLASENPRFMRYLSLGPYGMRMHADIGQSFLVVDPPGNVIAHYGADFTHWRLGLLPGTGMKIVTGDISFDFRLQIPVFYESSEITNLVSPIPVTDLYPTDIEDYQEELARVSAGVVVSVRMGFVFNKKK